MEKMGFLCTASAIVAADLITGMGSWEETPQGVDYWKEVHENLKRLVRENPPKPPQPQYRTPTDDDAKSRPTVRVRESNDHPWQEQTLMYVDEKAASRKYFATRNPTSRDISRWHWWRQCEIIDDGGPL